MDTTLPQYEPVHDEFWALSVMATTMDNVRFRVWGIQPDVQRQRPAGFNRSMIDTVSAMRRSEEAMLAAVKDALANDTPTIKTDFNAQSRTFVPSVEAELGHFLVARDDTLGVLRGLTAEQWQRTVNDPTQGKRTIAQLTIERAQSDLQYLDELNRLRHALSRIESLQVR